MKLEVGKTYIARDGSRVVIYDLHDNQTYPFKGFYGAGATEWLTYAENGKVWIHDEDPKDIISEVIEPENLQQAVEEQQKPLSEVCIDGEARTDVGSDQNLTAEEILKPIKLEVGKMYLTRDGHIVKISKLSDNPDFPFLASISKFQDISYTSEGKVYMGKEDDLDIIKEIEEPGQETITTKERQKPLFEAGNIYKNKKGQAVRIIAVDYDCMTYPIIGRVGQGIALSYTIEGKAVTDRDTEYDLVQPEPPLPIIIGGFYLDSLNFVRVLVQTINKEYLEAVAVSGECPFGTIVKSNFPYEVDRVFKLVKILTYEEAQKLISEKLS